MEGDALLARFSDPLGRNLAVFHVQHRHQGASEGGCLSIWLVRCCSYIWTNLCHNRPSRAKASDRRTVVLMACSKITILTHALEGKIGLETA